MNPDGMTLEIPAVEHAEELFLLIRGNSMHLRKWLPWVDGVTSVEDASAFLSRTLDQRNQGLGSHYIVRYHGAMAGMAGFHPVDWANRNAETGYWLGREFTGRGLATASTEALLREGFLEMDLNRIEIRCASDNLRSIAVARRLGMVYEGTLREEEWLYDRYVDHDVYSILKREFSVGTD